VDIRSVHLRSRVSRALAALVVCTVTSLALVAIDPSSASADLTSNYLVSSVVNTSDPFAINCSDAATGFSGTCLYTSSDNGTGATGANPYPMSQTRLFTLADGLDPSVQTNWRSRGVVFDESQITTPNGFVPPGANHLWAPAVSYGPNGEYLLYVPDITDINDPHTSSRIAVARSSSPFGRFDFVKQIATPGYASDPEIFQSFEPARYLLFANGDGTNCGGLSIARLNESTFTDIVGTPQEIQISGISTLGISGSCTGKSHPYMEGPSMFWTPGIAGDLPGPYMLVFAAQPSTAPAECRNFGQPNTANEVIAYATADSPTGTFTYKGILMCGSSSEYTNQAYIWPMTTTTGQRRMVMIYHDGAGTNHNRKVHAECLWYGAGTIAMATRSATDFPGCMHGVDSNAWALRSRGWPGQGVWSAQPTDATGNGRLYSNRAAVGPWERFDVRMPNGSLISPTGNSSSAIWDVSMLAHANNLIVTSEATGTSTLIANRTAVGAWERFILVFDGLGGASFTNEASGLEVTTLATTGHPLRPTNPARAPDEVFDVLHL
jgi:hypothetical protein